MENFSGYVIYPAFDQIVDINRRMVETFGGSFVPPNNLLNHGSLDYILDAISGSVFGYELYPSLVEKASALGYRIIRGHVFNNGNKRTAIQATWEFLQSNGVQIYLDDSIKVLAVKVADHKGTYEEFLEWVQQHIGG